MTKFDQKIDFLRKLVQNRMDQLFDKSTPLSLYEPLRYAVKSGGKMIRPVLLLLSCEAVGGEPEEAVPAALAMELVHNFSLVHDDIMDNDELRRGRETVHKKWDQNVAILSGDALLVEAYRVIGQCQPAKLPAVLQEFSTGIFEVCEGQAFDKEFEERNDVSIEQYFEMIDKKTAKLISVSCQIGAMLGTDRFDHISALKNYGTYLGRAFQVQDDLLDVIADEAVLGKDIGSDLEEHKKTFILLHALENARGASLEFFTSLLNQKNISESQIRKANQLFFELGSVDAAREFVAREIELAGEELTKLPQSDAREHLRSFLDYIEKRNS